MEGLVTLLEKYWRSDEADARASRIAVRLVRCLKIGTRGKLELRYLLEDLDDSLAVRTQTQLVSDIRAASGALSKSEIPLKAHKRRIDELEANDRQKRQRRDLQDAQLLYDFLVPLPLPLNPQKRTTVASLLDQPASTVPFALPAEVTLTTLFALLEPMIPERGSFVAKKQKLSQLCQSPQESLGDSIEALHDLVQVAAQLCAPVRDAEAKAVVESVETCRELAARQMEPTSLESKLQGAMSAAAILLQNMQRDMKLFNLGLTVAANSDQELEGMVKQEAMKREKEAIAPAETMSVENWIKERLRRPEPFSREAVKAALIESLFHATPVTVDNSSAGDNRLPPIFSLAVRHLFLLQNRLQACIMLATLNTIVPVTASANWAERVHTVLTSQIVADGTSDSSLKLANVADEIVRAAKPDKEQEVKLRASVDRMINSEDPVYKLLSERLKASLIAESGLPKGLHFGPLPQELEQIRAALSAVLDWAYESWCITAQAS